MKNFVHLVSIMACSLFITSCTHTKNTSKINSNHLPDAKEIQIPSKEAKNIGTFKGAWVARGNEPFWKITATKNNLKVAQPSGSYDKPTQWSVLKEGKQTVLLSTTHKLKITFLKEQCIDNMSGKKFTHKVQVIINHDDLSGLKGCGYYK